MPIFKSLSLIGNCGLTLLDWEFKTSKNEIFDHKNGIKLILGRYLTFLTQEIFFKYHKICKKCQNSRFFGFFEKKMLLDFGPIFRPEGSKIAKIWWHQLRLQIFSAFRKSPENCDYSMLPWDHCENHFFVKVPFHLPCFKTVNTKLDFYRDNKHVVSV